jgi:hypothetical protein
LLWHGFILQIVKQWKRLLPYNKKADGMLHSLRLSIQFVTYKSFKFCRYWISSYTLLKSTNTWSYLCLLLSVLSKSFHYFYFYSQTYCFPYFL